MDLRSNGTLHLTSSVKGIVGKFSLSALGIEEEGRFFLLA